jgi:hypothetical protein
VSTRGSRAAGASLAAMFVLAAVFALAAAGCTVNGQRAADLEASADPHKVNATVQGVVSLVGSEPNTAVIVTTAEPDGTAVALIGPGAVLLQRVAGLQVEAEGLRTGGPLPPAVPPGTLALEVHRFVVTAVDGVPALDGVIEEHDGAFHLRLADGELLPAPALPPTLRQHVGARVFLAGPLDRAPAAYGIIVDKP